MDQESTNSRTSSRRVRTLGMVVMVGASSMLSTMRPASGQSAARTPSVPPAAWVEAIRQTQEKGVPTVLIVTSRVVPLSTNVARDILAHPCVARIRQEINVVEICAEDEPVQVKRMGATHFPTFVLLRASPGGRLEAVANHRGSLSGEALCGWLMGTGALEVVARRDRTHEDPNVLRTGGQDGQPSPSSQYCPTPAPPAKVIPAPPPVEREVVVEEQPVEQEYVIEREVEQPTEVVREVVVERAPQPERERVVYVERAAPSAAPRNVLTRSVPAPAPTPTRERVVYVQRAAPRAAAAPRAVQTERVREVVVERAVAAAPREVVAVPARARVAQAVQPVQPRVALIRPGFLGRTVGAVGENLRRVGLPRVDVAVQNEQTYTFAQPRESTVYMAEQQQPVLVPQQRQVCAAPPSAPPTQYSPPAPSPQSH